MTLPPGMLEAARWIAWRPVPDRHDPNKINKVPLNPFTNEPFEKKSGWQTDPSLWMRVEQMNGQRKGFMLGDGWAGIDLDDCVIEGTVAPWVLKLVSLLGTYAEISPSGTGVKLFMKGTLPDGAKNERKCAAWKWEIYDRARYFTFTGDKLPESPCDIADRTAQLKLITELVFGDELIGLCKLRGLYISESGESVHIRCPWIADHSHGSGDKDTALQVKDGKVIGFHCFHAHCAERTLRDIRKWFGVNAGLEHPLTEAGDAECFAGLYQDRLRYDHHRGRWLVTDETSGIWVPDPVERLTQLTIAAMRVRQEHANPTRRHPPTSSPPSRPSCAPSTAGSWKSYRPTRRARSARACT